MIKKINRIRNYGVFQDFKWNRGIPEFKKYNLIYAWNYAGKTTLSRIFRSFELKKEHTDYVGGDFEIEDDNQRKYGKSDLDKFSDIRVYNVDYVKNNLKWQTDAEEFEPIFILGEENIEQQEFLKNKKENKRILEEEAESIAAKINKLNSELNSALSERAKLIKRTLSWPDYEKRNLEKAINKIGSNCQNYILLDSDYSDTLAVYKSTDKKDSLSKPDLPLLEFQILLDRTKILSKKQVISQIIDKLKDNNKLSDWVQEGIELHKNKKVCEFCGNELPEDLLNRLEGHFSKDFENLQRDIITLEKSITKHRTIINDYFDAFPHKARLYTELEDEYNSEILNLKYEIEKYSDHLDQLSDFLDIKKQKPFEEVVVEIFDFDFSQIGRIDKLLCSLIERHNSKTDEFDKMKSEARNRLQYHFAADFVREKGYFDTNKNISDLNNKLKECYSQISKIEREINLIEIKISNISKGADRINKYLKSFFRDDALKILPTEKGMFKLYRHNVVAKNLSEGEKTAISFTHFVASLEDRKTDIKNCIIYVDDPVCSLDTNHIHSVYAFIKEIFGGYKCKQFFITTHNLEFFNLMKDFIKQELGIRGAGDERTPFYLIERTFNSVANKSTITSLPVQLRKFNSEYTYLFSLLYAFYRNPNDDFKMLHLLPNICRRILEAYLGFRIPDSRSWISKINALIVNSTDAGMVVKFVHDYSHEQSSERFLSFPDLNECKQVVSLIINALEMNDKSHFDALSEQCN